MITSEQRWESVTVTVTSTRPSWPAGTDSVSVEPEPPPVELCETAVFCPGCLVVGGPTVGEDPEAAKRCAQHPAFSDWPLIVLTDEPRRAAASAMNFLWTTFTRFEPAADIHAADTRIVRNHLSHTAPILIDARLKPGFPDELFCDDGTAARVTQRWNEYFPDGMEMGDSGTANLTEY